MTEQLKTVREFMAEYADPLPEELNGKEQLIADLGFNSLTLFELVDEAEKRFSVSFNDDGIMQIVTVDDFIDLLNRKNAKF